MKMQSSSFNEWLYWKWNVKNYSCFAYRIWKCWNFWKETVIGGFSCVNTRLAFDSQILLPNLKNKGDLENNPIDKDYNYKAVYNLKMNNEKVKKRESLKF